MNLLLASDTLEIFGHFESFDDRILVVLNVRKKRVEGSVTLLCILRVRDDALQEISLLTAHILRDQKAAT